MMNPRNARDFRSASAGGPDRVKNISRPYFFAAFFFAAGFLAAAFFLAGAFFAAAFFFAIMVFLLFSFSLFLPRLCYIL